jgi:hypothetical protein
LLASDSNPQPLDAKAGALSIRQRDFQAIPPLEIRAF